MSVPPPRRARGAAEAYLASLERFGMRPGLERIRLLLAACGDPQRSFRCIHVAGTNGKGSVCAMTESVLRAAGLRTGLYTSPHLFSFRERIRCLGEPIGMEEADALAAELIPAATQIAAGPAGPPTWFEFMTAMAFLRFARAGVDCAVVETGLGGRLDATRPVEAPVAAIVSVGLEHAEILGGTVAAIAAEKAGIIAEGASVVCGEMGEEAFEAIRRRAAERGAAVLRVGDGVRFSVLREGPEGSVVDVRGPWGLRGPLPLPLAGRHQAANCAVAVALVEALRERGETIAPEAVARGIEATRWPGRIEIVRRAPLTVVDCAHNPDGARAAAAAVRGLFPGLRWALVLGLLRDKDAGGICDALAPLAAELFTTAVPSARTADAAALAALCRARTGRRAVPAAGPAEALARAERAVASGAADGVLVAGSIYLAGEAMKLTGDVREET